MIPDREIAPLTTVIAHRGASGSAPENTLASIRRALDIGARMIEIDVHTAKDGELVVMHDSDVSRTTNGSGAISEMTLDELRKLDAGSWFDSQYSGERIPTLDEVLRTVRGRAELCVENKNASPGAIVEVVRRRDQVDQVILFDFNHARVYEAKDVEPRVRTLALGVTGDILSSLDAERLDLVGASNSRTDAALVGGAHDLGLAVFVYTVNDEADMSRLIELGVDGIITNRPEMCIPLLEDGC